MKLENSNFDLSEFKSKDTDSFPNDVLVNLIELIKQLDIIRNYINEPIIVNSGYRTPEHNAIVGGVKSSYHIQGKAADIRTKKYSATQLYDIIKMLQNDNKINLGYAQVYKSRGFVHVDIGPTRKWS